MLGQMRSRLEQLAPLQELAARHSAELTRLRERIDVLVEKEMGHLRKDVGELRRAVLRHAQAANRALRQAGFFDEQAAHEQALARLVERAKRTGRPVLAGPWTGEIGFEVLYWIPFLRRLKSRLGERCAIHVLSRGGPSPWYEGIASAYHDIFAVVEPAEFRQQTDRETRKQRSVGSFDRALVREVCRASGISKPIVLHPSLMYNLLYPYWKDQLPLRRLFEYLAPTLFGAPPPLPEALQLPAEYVAVRFYFSRCFPDTPSNRTLVRDVVGQLAERTPVVLLDLPVSVDDHRDAVLAGPNVRSIAPFLTPENNLAVQSAVISRARAFVGTYGGFSYVAPLYRVPSVTFYSEATFFEQHLELARRTFSQLGAAPFVVLTEQDRALVHGLLASTPVA